MQNDERKKLKRAGMLRTLCATKKEARAYGGGEGLTPPPVTTAFFVVNTLWKVKVRDKMKK